MAVTADHGQTPSSTGSDSVFAQKARAGERRMAVVRFYGAVAVYLFTNVGAGGPGRVEPLHHAVWIVAILYAGLIYVARFERRFPPDVVSALTVPLDGALSMMLIVTSGGRAGPLNDLLYPLVAAVALRYNVVLMWIATAGYLTMYVLTLGLTGDLSWPDLQLVVRMVLVVVLAALLVAHTRLAVEKTQEKVEMERLATAAEQARRRQNQLTEELARSNKDLEAFASAASHDLQEPLRVVRGMADLLQRRLGDDLPEDAKEFLDHIHEAVGRLQGRIDALLAYSRASSRPLEPEEVDLNALLQEVRQDLAALIDESGAEIDAPDLPVVHGNASLLARLLQNVVANAIKYRREGVAPRVEIQAEQDEDTCRISVTDNGVGVSAKDAESVFQVFHRAAATLDRPGHGVGLSVAKRVVERHGGTIELTSPGVDQGTTVSFTLPTRGPGPEAPA